MAKPLTLNHLHQLMDLAKNNLVSSQPRAKFQGMARSLTEGERLALAYFDAALTTLGSAGVDVSGVSLETQVADSESDND